MGGEIARAEPEVRVAVEKGLKQIQKAWADRLGSPDAAWAVIAQCMGALVLSRAVEKERTRKEIIASTRKAREQFATPDHRYRGKTLVDSALPEFPHRTHS
ncbi:hypothetical protein D3C71_1622080 [compost metagenome]